MDKVRIISIPPGFAPEEIRKDWVGLELPLVTEQQLEQRPVGTVSIGHENEGGYLVDFDGAIQTLLVAGRLESADFWSDYAWMGYLRFHRDVCEEIE